MSDRSSLIESMHSLEEHQRIKLLSEFSDEELLAIMYDWHVWARPKQLPPEGKWVTWLIRSGRGFGKTRTGAEWVRMRVEQGFGHIALVGQTKADVRDTMVEVGPASILKISPPWNKPTYEPSKRRLTWPNGATAVIYSGDEPDQLRGPQHDTAWVDELAKFQYPQETWDNLMFGLRLGEDPRVCVTTTPRPIPIIRQLLRDPDTVDVVGSTYENKANLNRAFLDLVHRKYGGTRLGRQELEGQLLEDNPNALWKRSDIDDHRVYKHPDLVRVVVAIDPAATSDSDSDETGIVVAGLGNDGHGYVLGDHSLRDKPSAWGNEAVTAYHRYKADRIIGEANNGGDMIEHVIHTIDVSIPYSKVVATRGKVTRAEPISALYEQGRVHHVGTFATLEDQMCEWVQGQKSPDRMDALVWALTELMLEEPPTKIRARSVGRR